MFPVNFIFDLSLIKRAAHYYRIQYLGGSCTFGLLVVNGKLHNHIL